MSDARHFLTRFIKFAGVGAIATMAHYLVLIVLVEILDVYPVTATFLGYLNGLIVSYFLNYRYTFNSSNVHRITFTRFLVVALVGMTLNVVIVKLAIEQVGLHYFIAQLFATGMVLLWNFGGNHYWTFRDSK